MSKTNVIDLIKKVDEEIKNIRPEKEKIVQEIKMMNFKIRTLSGDIFTMRKERASFMEALWKIGKIESIVNKALLKLNSKDKKLFLEYFFNLQRQTQEKIASMIEKKSPDDYQDAKVFEFEVFKDIGANKKN